MSNNDEVEGVADLQKMNALFVTPQAKAEESIKFQSLPFLNVCQFCHAEQMPSGSEHTSSLNLIVLDLAFLISGQIPEAVDLHLVDDRRRGYVIKICKTCRGRLIGMLVEWRSRCIKMRDVDKMADGCPIPTPDRTTPHMQYGATVYLTPAEYEERTGIKPESTPEVVDITQTGETPDGEANL